MYSGLDRVLKWIVCPVCMCETGACVYFVLNVPCYLKLAFLYNLSVLNQVYNYF